MKTIYITKDQCRAARMLLNIKQQDLADLCGVSKTSIINFESGLVHPRNKTIALLRLAFEKLGIEFIEQRGISKSPDTHEFWAGDDLSQKIHNYILQMSREHHDIQVFHMFSCVFYIFNHHKVLINFEDANVVLLAKNSSLGNLLELALQKRIVDDQDAFN